MNLFKILKIFFRFRNKIDKINDFEDLTSLMKKPSTGFEKSIKILSRAAELKGLKIIKDSTIVQHYKNKEKIRLINSRYLTVFNGLEKIPPIDSLVNSKGRTPWRLEFVRGSKKRPDGFYWISFSMRKEQFENSLLRFNDGRETLSDFDYNGSTYIYDMNDSLIQKDDLAQIIVWNKDNTINARIEDVGLKFLSPITDPDKEEGHDNDDKVKTIICQKCPNGGTIYSKSNS